MRLSFQWFWKSSSEMFSPLWRLSSIKVWIPCWVRALCKWLTKPRRVFSPRKLKKTSKFLSWWDEAIRIYEQTDEKSWKEEKEKEKESCERGVNIESKESEGRIRNWGWVNGCKRLDFNVVLLSSGSFWVKPKITLWTFKEPYRSLWSIKLFFLHFNIHYVKIIFFIALFTDKLTHHNI